MAALGTEIPEYELGCACVCVGVHFKSKPQQGSTVGIDSDVLNLTSSLSFLDTWSPEASHV